MRNRQECDEKVEPYFQNNAKWIVDSMFDAKIFHDRITRDDLNAIEDVIAHYFQSHARSGQKCFELMFRLKNQSEEAKK